jgi:hypothetical protein
MNEVAVAYPRDGVEADIVASALRAERLHPRIALDNTLGLGAGMTTSTGRRIVYVPEAEGARAREILGDEGPDEREDNPVVRMVVIVAIITGLLLATPFVAQICAGRG